MPDFNADHIVNGQYYVVTSGVYVHGVSREVLYPYEVVAELTNTLYEDVVNFYAEKYIEPYQVIHFDKTDKMSRAVDVQVAVDEDQLLVYLLRLNPMMLALDVQTMLKKQMKLMHGVV